MTVSYDFTGRVAIVTGASNGIGRAIASALHRAGAVVWNWDLTDVANAGVRFAQVDVTDAAAIAGALEAATGGSGPVDILVNNAGFTGGSHPVEGFDPALWRRVVEVNLTGTFEVCRAVLPALRRSRGGRIVNMASLAGTPVRVNCIAPAAVETAILSQMAPATVAAMIAKSPMGRLGTVDEITAMALWLCSGACSFSTGAAFDASGGRATY